MIPRPADVLAARARTKGHVDATPLRASAWLTDAQRAPVSLKLECVQRTGSFKIRGAVNALARLGRGTHVVTASAGNHGRAVALAAETFGLRATVFAPEDAPRNKTAAIRRHGAELRHEADYDAAERAAQAFAASQGLPFVSPYNHPDVVAGAGTIGLEIFEAQPHTGTLVVPIGGGGLVSGIAIVARALSPRVRIVGVEVAASCAFSASLRAGRVTTIAPGPTLADGLGGNIDAGSITFEIVRTHVDEIVTVTEEELAAGLRGLLRDEHLVVEGAGAAAAAAILAGKVMQGGQVVALVTGSNIDADRLLSVVSR